MTAIRLSIHGRVQGVFYRDWTVRNARELGLGGWVRNCPDGTVAAHLQGEEAAVRTMIARMRSGPAARVDRIEQQAAMPDADISSFQRR
ncbi:acylphosphatase [Altererythrobacter atlanticus]|uniref:acylphosphatase n=1 Tax=Croceibacterium atlanticum TaxID=1267766 RepID=A0A0F7KT52_9SPHN|nr:acylphosphatase [Croceibacterium atlanticum]AKH41965.1 Acylphosphatase [Croceibacterium atlanticum]MBB5733467.1 acylphosphatase [Croceibacterium atlanticum]